MIHHTSIETHAQDIDQWVNYFIEHYDKIVIIGHSLGCPAIYISKSVTKEKVRGLVYLEPSISMSSPREEHVEWNDSLQVYISKGGIRSLFSKELIDNWYDLDGSVVLGIDKKQLFVFGKQGILLNEWSEIARGFTSQTKQIVIQDSAHGFSENDSMEEMCDEVVDFIKSI